MDIKVSVIIPVHNVEKYLKQCIDSVLNQTFKDIEVIVVNDCSTDNSLKIIKEYQKKDKRINLIDLKQNVGAGFARNEGVKHAKGEYITFVDSDDWVKENFIEVLYNSIKKYNTDFVSVNYIRVYDDKFVDHKVKSNLCDVVISDEKIKKQVLLNIPSVQVWSKIFKKSFLFSKEIFFRANKLEDIIYVWEAIVKSKSFLFLQDQLYNYRLKRENSEMYGINKKIYDYKFCLYKDLKQMLKDINSYKFYETVFFYYITRGTVRLIEKLQIKTIFTCFRKEFYNKKTFKLNINCSKDFLFGLKLIIFKFCLITNINYYFIAKLYMSIKQVKK
ncbi:MAG: glycosyltransferase [Elusimicrobia bacterium]|nr:glycosyltransferase [Elusimicrobiota bacterium]